MTFTATTMRELMALGLPQDKLDAVIAIMERARLVKTEAKGGAKDKAKRGTRLAEDWVPTEEWLRHATQPGMLRRDEAMRQAQRFRDYWLSVAGARGLKLDWFATWRTWISKECERLGRSPVAAAGPSATDPAAFTRETWAAILKAYRRSNNWNPEHGPMPGRLRCLAPSDLILSILK